MSSLHRTRRTTSTFIALSVLAVAFVAAILPAAGAAPPKCFGREATLVGTNADNELVGTNGRDVIVARGGNDTIDARRGRDLICAGRGDFDVVFAGRGNDKVAGEGGFDYVFPGPGADFVNGGGGGCLVSYEGTSTPVEADLSSGVIRAQGRDRVRRVQGVFGGESDDILVGTRGFNNLQGFGGDDIVRGRGGEDFLNSGAGDDTVSGGGGDDFLDLVVAHAGPGIGDDVLATSGAVVDMPSGTVAGGSDVGKDAFSSIEAVGTTLGDDTITGTKGPNGLFTFDGDDNVQARAGNDFIAPGPADDVVRGGAGDDELDFFLSHPFEPGQDGPVNVDLGTQSATGQGTDQLASIERAAGTLLDDTLVGSDAPNSLLLGDEGSDVISGEGGDDVLDGDIFSFGFPDNLPGDDSLDGGAGNDTCLGGETNQNCETVEEARRGATLDRDRAANRTQLHYYRPMPF